MRVKLRFWHGLGDCVQFSICLKHLAKYRPYWKITVISRPPFQSLFADYPEQPEYDYEKDLWFSFGKYGYSDRVPATKVVRCLVRELEFAENELDPSLWVYEFPKLRCPIVETFLDGVGPFVLIHGWGVSSPKMKNLSFDEISHLIGRVRASGQEPILIDFRSELPVFDCLTARMPFSIASLSNLLGRADRLIGVDSGPEHAAIALGLPTTLIWKLYHCGHNCEPGAENWITVESFKEVVGDLPDWFWESYDWRFWNDISDIHW